MKQANIFVQEILTGVLEEIEIGQNYRFRYDNSYNGPPVSLTMPTSERSYEFTEFPPFFDGLLPEGFQLESLLKRCKIDRTNLFEQLITVGQDLIEAVTVERLPS